MCSNVTLSVDEEALMMPKAESVETCSNLSLQMCCSKGSLAEAASSR